MNLIQHVAHAVRFGFGVLALFAGYVPERTQVPSAPVERLKDVIRQGFETILRLQSPRDHAVRLLLRHCSLLVNHMP